MITKESRKKKRLKIRRRIRAKVKGTAEMPRLAVFRSLKHIYIQAVDDEEGRTLLSVSSLEKEFKTSHRTGSNVEAAKAIGKLVASRLKEKGIERCVYDRGGWRYHGRVKALAEAIREGGITI